jgi:glycosyltransferase involved in cell wall biosynthesis
VGLDATICVGTFGGNEWAQLAHERAIPSAKAQGCEVVYRHGATLARARNEALALVETPWAVFLDADDELAPDYLEALGSGSADLRAPSVSYVKLGRPRVPYVPKVAGHVHDCTSDCLRDGNWLVVGTGVRTDLARQVGGFREYEVYEDWDFFQRCWLAGASVEAVPDAVYLAHWRRDSRNRAPGMALKNRVHHEIVAANLGDAQVAA